MTHTVDWLIEHNIVLEGQVITYSYDKESDILEIIFQKGQGGIGVDLTENITLRYNRDNQDPLSLILISFSHLIRSTEFGPPSFQLTALAELSLEMQQTVLRLLDSFPVNRFLKLSGLRLSPGGELQPITYLTQPAELPLDKVLAWFLTVRSLTLPLKNVEYPIPRSRWPGRCSPVQKRVSF